MAHGPCEKKKKRVNLVNDDLIIVDKVRWYGK